MHIYIMYKRLNLFFKKISFNLYHVSSTFYTFLSQSVEENPDAKSVNGCTSKPTKEYNLLPAIVGYPRAGDKIAFKVSIFLIMKMI